MMTEVPQFRKVGCVGWYDGYADHDDGNGPYEERVLYGVQQAVGQELQTSGGDPMTGIRVVEAIKDEIESLKSGKWDENEAQFAIASLKDLCYRLKVAL